MLSNEVSRIQRGISSAGRAPALQAGGRRFDPVILHQNLKISSDVYLWLLRNQIATLFNKMEEGCVTAVMSGGDTL